MGKYGKFSGKKAGKQKPGAALVRSGRKIGDQLYPHQNPVDDGQDKQNKALPGGVSSALAKPDSDALTRSSGSVPTKYTTANDAPDFSAYARRGEEQDAVGALVGGIGELNIAILLDATGSMASLISTAKTQIRALMRQLMKTLKVKMMIAAYRDYCDGRNAIYTTSSLTTNAEELYLWLDRVGAHGGGDGPEAIEYALGQLIGKGFHMAVVCGDAPSHSRGEIVTQIEKYGFSGKETRTAVEVAAELWQLQTPVHMLVVGGHSSTTEDFKQIARAGGGEQGDLDEGTAFLDMITMAALHRAGGTGAVQDYIFKHGKALSPGAERFGKALVKYRGDSLSRFGK